MARIDVIGIGGDSSCSSLTNFQTIPFDCGMSAGNANDDAFYRRQTNRNRIAKRYFSEMNSIFTIMLISRIVCAVPFHRPSSSFTHLSLSNYFIFSAFFCSVGDKTASVLSLASHYGCYRV